LALCLFAVAEENIMLANAQKAMVAELGHQELVPWLTTAFSFTAAGFNQLYGSFATVFDRKWVLVTATTFYATGALIVGLSHSMSTVIVGRCIQGVGRGGLFSMVLVIIADIVTPKYRAIFQGVVGAMFALSAFLAPFFASAFVDAGQWRW
ncbi:major facilitator superfamily, partial [Chytriomyces sp. MP71]